ncbi:lytic transglycosylase domain-containing protein [Mesorhizobium sp. M8A.F.Ca.ET.208.01.1.1]|uniref:lytic transglycosylase domain-containing protein n=1 Tax=unclassified Mesorhizobium TaxID=325217 RepID=UPI000F758483|nr:MULTISPECIES: lytic transglycosylase domain-containing protein [unclassified Mesorhizobium]RUX10244.1 lytic transglycosylase domain-containing protein [Mesorhizobium sp. M8A.F.Ca.ET.059.01.1.1]AZO54387.1 lytic transglycosylase domain-containing protein [Mesorhizobium sp. M8A.F.Ca.ET.057.01.1.1]RWE49828.1 MAG: lytic transglycosylase domain-containing protein [Mesorhizobium sp.]TGQ94559.1 lytic transglycosylase domain-containing protein [Mesorhizobium sp. M8A.F.Ca.ET.208.01.1.1]TGT55047.1 lyt
MPWPFLPRRKSTAAGRHRAALHAGLLLLSGLLLVGAPSGITLAQSVPGDHATSIDPYAAHIAEAARRFGIPAAWIRAVMRVESANDLRAVSRKGAIGLMQLMPGTWAELRVRHSLGTDPFNPRDNILAGAAYLRELHDHYGSPGFLAAYNAGPGRYEEYLAGRPLPAETRAYVAALLPIFGGGELTASATVAAAANPHAWTRAPLFIAQFERTTTADPVQRGGTRDDAPIATIARDVSAIAPQSGGLFVARNRMGEPQ